MPTGPMHPAFCTRGVLKGATSACLLASLMVAGSASAQASTSESAVTAQLPGYPTPGQPVSPAAEERPSTTVEKDESDIRVATLHAGLRAGSSAELLDELEGGMHPAARVLAETVQANAPDVLVLTGISYDENEKIAETLNSQYLARGQNGQTGMQYSYTYTAPTNSGIDSGADLDGDGRVGGPADAIGYGNHPGERGMAVFSAHPIVQDEVRTFQEFLWEDMPENSIPEGQFSNLEKSVLRLPSTSMWDVPIEVPGEPGHVHVVATDLNSSPRSARPDEARNEDQRRMVTDFVSGSAWYLYDDDGARGGLGAEDSFVIAGSLADEQELMTSPAEKVPELSTLLKSEVLQDPAPEAVTDEPLPERDGDADPKATQGLSNGEAVRSSYVLPATALEVDGTGVFWPAEGEFGFDLVDPAESASPSGRLVWLDIATS